MNIFKTNPSESHVKMLLFGPSGSGKSHSSSRIGDTFGKALYLNFETKDLSVAKGVDQVRINSRAELGECYTELSSGKTEYGTIILDSMTSYMYHQVMPEVSLEEGKGNKAAEKGEISLRGWGLVGHRMQESFIKFVSLPMHIIFTALEQRDKDESTGRITLLPMFAGKTAERAPSWVSFVGHTEVNDNYTIRFKRIPNTYAKAEGGALAESEPSDLAPLFTKILGDSNDD